MKRNLYVLGAGGMAREVVDLLHRLKLEQKLAAMVEDNSKREGEQYLGCPIIDTDNLPRDLGDSKFICAIGAQARSGLLARIKSKGGSLESIIDPGANVSDTAKVGAGAVIMAGAIVSSQVVLGESVIVNYRASISHDCTVGRVTTICPGVSIGGYVTIGESCWIGIGATIKDRVSVGARSLVGAGSVVVRDIPEGVVAFGVPARPVRDVTPPH